MPSERPASWSNTDFEQDDWFEELTTFYRTDVEVPATMFVEHDDVWNTQDGTNWTPALSPR